MLAECKPRHRHQEFLAFLRSIDKAVPAELDVHCIVDNYSSHKHPKVKAWLAARPRWHMHFIPTYSSWLNQVERFFSIITGKAIRRGSFASVKELVNKIDHFVAHYNQNCKPFTWTATADSILAKLNRLCERISGTGRSGGRHEAARTARPRAGLVWLLGFIFAGCATRPEPVPEIRPGLLAGYLGKELPDSLALLPPPPARARRSGTTRRSSRASQKLRGTPRYALAAADADLSFPHAPAPSAARSMRRSPSSGSPYLYQLMRRVLTDAGLATYGAKDHYKRVRPFVHFNEGTCTPHDEQMLRNDGSYPSGHTSIGWAWALVLTELAPERRDALLARGRAFGESRMVCNAHWQSDILEGRTVGAGAVAQLHSNPVFMSDMKAAKREIDAMRRQNAKADGNCAGEAAALAIKTPGVL